MYIPTLDELECLVMWPLGTVGEQNERRLVQELLQLCEEFGFGRVPQVAKQIEALWRDPENKVKFQQLKDDHVKRMEEYKRVLRE